jgi:precorrin-6A/cobalt-precorrin-6A reductase
MAMVEPHVLILGGTGDARMLAARLAKKRAYRVTLSLAGRTKAPADQGVATRIGGFGGPEGLRRYMEVEGIALLVDATHPFAAQMSRHAWLAAQAAGIAMVALDRPAWTQQAGDNWLVVPDMIEAARAIGSEARRVFLTIGRQELAPFAAHPQHSYLVRSVDPADVALPNAITILDRGPFDEATEETLMRHHRIEVLVTKNSGGDATYGKIAAARRLSLPVVMVARPAPSGAPTVNSLDALEAWLDAHDATLAERGA